MLFVSVMMGGWVDPASALDIRDNTVPSMEKIFTYQVVKQTNKQTNK